MFSRLFGKRRDPDQMAQEAIADYAQDHDELDVISRLTRAIALGLKVVPVDRAYLILGAANDDIDQVAEAEDAYLKALEYNPENATALSNLGMLYATRGEFAKAEANYERAIALRPTEAKYKSNLASLYMDQARYEEARRVLKLAIEQANASPFVFANLARCHAYLGDFGDAQAAFEAASRRRLTDVAGLQAELREIQKELAKVHVEPRALHALAVSLIRTEPESLALLDEAIEAPARVYRELAAKGRAFFLKDYVVPKAFPWLLLCDELIRKELAVPWGDRSLGEWHDVLLRLWGRSGHAASAQSREASRQAVAHIEYEMTEQEPTDEAPDSDADGEVDAFEAFIGEVSNELDAVVLLLSESPERDLIALLPRVTWERLEYPFVDAGDGYGSVRVLSEPKVAARYPIH